MADDEFKDTSDMSYDADTGVLKMYLKGRPINLCAPSDVMADYDLEAVASAPDQKLAVNWVYGYRGKDCRSNLHQLATGETAFFSAAVVILQNFQEQTQRHYIGHTDDVKCMAVHPDQSVIASGQCAGTKSTAQPQVHVWDVSSLETLHVLGVDTLERSISCLAFSRTDGGAMLACVDDGQDRILSVWNWQDAEKVAETKAASDTVLAVEWSPTEEGALVTCGKQHVAFFQLDSGELTKRQGVFGDNARPKYVTCLTFNGSGDLISGDTEGQLLVWAKGGNEITQAVPGAHEAAVFALYLSEDGSLISGAKGGKLLEWDGELVQTGNSVEVPAEFGAPRTVCRGADSQLLIGTTSNCIVSAADWGQEVTALLRGHTDEVWALAVSPEQPLLLTGAWDKQLLLHNLETHTTEWSTALEEGVQCACFSPDGTRMVVGMVTGRWDVLDADSKERLFTNTNGSEPIQTARFSPDGTMVALGSRNNKVYIYQQTEDGYQALAKCTGHSSFVTHLDWSADSVYLRTNSGDYELLYWTAASGEQQTDPSEMRDTEWATHTCTLAFNSLGVYPEAADGTDVNTCCRSTDGRLMASGDDWGRVKLFSYPVNQAKSRKRTYGGHSSHVTQVEFSSDGQFLLSAGGRDMTAIQWTVE